MAENLLGKRTPIAERYSPDLLFAIPRAPAREELGLDGAPLPFSGEDVWHAWELSWLDGEGRPRVAVGRFTIPCDSPMLIESKSFKLYLNSLYKSGFADEAALVGTLERDLSAVAQAMVSAELLPLEHPELQPATLPGMCLDVEKAGAASAEPDAALLRVSGEEAEQVYHSNLLRSLCPVTAQPDWASVVIEVHGSQPRPNSLLDYLLAYRQHQEFHEQCVERIYRDLRSALQPRYLSVQALYTRRGGLDINPWRSSERSPAPRRRSPRQ